MTIFLIELGNMVGFINFKYTRSI